MSTNYDALISYSTNRDEAISRELRRRLIHFAKPFWRLRAVRVYRDNDSGVPSPDVRSGLRKVVQDARFLILLACPESASSDYVRWEIAEWTRSVLRRGESPSEQLVIVLTSGQIMLTERSHRIDWDITDALPDDLTNPWSDSVTQLSKIIVGTPRIENLSWMHESANWRRHESELTDVVSSISGLLRNKPKEDLKSEEILRHRRKVRIIAVALVLFMVLGFFATWQWRVSQRRAETIRADAIVSLARLMAEQDPLNASLLLSELDLRIPTPPDATQLGLDLLKENVPVSFLRLWKSNVSDLVFDPIGERLLVGTNTDGAYIWDWSDGDQTIPVVTPYDLDQIYLLEDERPRLRNITFDRQGRIMAATSQDTSGYPVLAWTKGVSNPPVTLGRHNGPITSLSFSQDGRTILTSSKDKTVCLWSVDSQIKYVGSHNDIVHDASFSSDSQRIVTAAKDGVHIWSADLTDDRLFDSADHPVGFFDASSRWVLGVSSAGTANVWNEGGYSMYSTEVAPLSFSILRPLHSIQSVLIDNSISNKDQVLLYFTGQRFQRKPIKGSGEMEAFAVTASRGLFAFSTKNRVEVRSIKSNSTNQVLKSINGKQIAMAFSKDGRFLATGSEDRVSVWDLDYISHGLFAGHTDKVWTAQYGPDGTHILTAALDGTARIWSRKGESEVFTHTSPVLAASFAPDGLRFVTATNDGHAAVWSLSGHKRLHELHLKGESIEYARFHPNGESVVLSTKVIESHGHGRIYVWQLASGVAELIHEDLEYPIGLASYNHDGTQIVFRTDNYDIAVYGLNKETRLFREHKKNPIGSIELAPQGDLVVSASGQEAVVWRLHDLKTVVRFKHPGAYHVASAVFDTTGQRIVTTTSMDDRIFIWDIDNPSSPMTISTGHKELRHPVFSPDGNYILAPTGDDVLEYPTHLSSILPILRRRTNETLSADYRKMIKE